MNLNPKLDRIESVIDRLTKQTEKAIIRQYASKLRSMRSVLADAFAKYEQDGVLTFSEMSKYGRLSVLEQDILDEVKKLYRDNGNLIRSTLRETYTESYYRAGWALETTTRAKLGYSYLKPEVVNRIIQNPLTGLTLNERLQRNRNQTLIRLKEQLTQGLVNGESYRQVSSRIKDIVEKDIYSSMRIVRTEATRCYNEGVFDSVKHASERGVEMQKKWVSSRDVRTRDSHSDLDGQTVGIDSSFEIDGHSALYPGGFGVASLDIMCRCVVAYEVTAINKPTTDLLDGVEFGQWKKERLR